METTELNKVKDISLLQNNMLTCALKLQGTWNMASPNGSLYSLSICAELWNGFTL